MQNVGLKRDVIDKFYTKNDIVDRCIYNIKKTIKISEDDLIIEPSAGNGSFISGIKTLCNNYRFYDLKPENSEIKEQDYLSLDLSQIKNMVVENGNIHIIGNPPFGRQSALAGKFLKKSCEHCYSISFILPKSFKKDSYKNKIDKQFHLLFEEDLPNNSFLLNDKDYDVPCVFQIWCKKEHSRTIIEKIKPVNFIFVKKNENPDISFIRVGGHSGKIDNNIADKNTNSHYFIKFTNGLNIIENMEKLKNIKFEFNNTVGPKSISKPELITQFNLFLS